MRASIAVLLGLYLNLLSSGVVESVEVADRAPQHVYQQAMQQASKGHYSEASLRLRATASALPEAHPWRQRMETAAALISMRQVQSVALPPLTSPLHKAMLNKSLQDRPAPNVENTWVPTALSVLLPGSGHAWMGRWSDALVAAVMVWPMLLLTLWAMRRDMGPVTVFFAMITTWLWSGTAFSAMSLSERANAELYMLWWQQLWLSSGLTGAVPW